MGWFEVDKEGLAKLLRRRGMEFVLYELVQNAWDTEATDVRVTLDPIAGVAAAELVVVDDDPDGFKDIAHAFTLFAESNRKGNAEQRGRFNLGEKLVLAVCDEATISTTTGTIEFAGGERIRRRAKREHGSEFRARIRMTREEIRQVDHAATLLIPPVRNSRGDNRTTYYNGSLLMPRSPLCEQTVTLPTELAGEDGVLRRTARKTAIRIYDRLPSEPARIYEMGIPVCETGDTYDVEVMQKVPLNTDRDNVTAGYLKTVRVFVLNAVADRLRDEDANESWVQQASNDDRAKPEAVVTAMKRRFGDDLVDYDPRDREANSTATAHGATVVPSNAIGKIARAKMREAGALPMAGDRFPTHGKEKAPSQLLSEQDLSRGMCEVRRFTRAVSEALLGFEAKVEFLVAPEATVLAQYGRRTLSFNVGRLGRAWFEHGITWQVSSLVIHELAHEFEADHLSMRYTRAVCDLAAKLAHLVAHNPERFGRLEIGDLK